MCQPCTGMSSSFSQAFPLPLARPALLLLLQVLPLLLLRQLLLRQLLLRQLLLLLPLALSYVAFPAAGHRARWTFACARDREKSRLRREREKCTLMTL